MVHQLSSGWLLDHLSFLTKINYQLGQPGGPWGSESEPPAVPSDSLPAESPRALADSSSKPPTVGGGSCQTFTQKYAFRAELFNITKPYITPAAHQEYQQRDGKHDLEEDKKENSVSVIGKVESFKTLVFFFFLQKKANVVSWYHKYFVIYSA